MMINGNTVNLVILTIFKFEIDVLSCIFIFCFLFIDAGDYVIIIQEITNPPFFDTTLQPAYCHVKVTAKEKRAKSKMDKK